MRKEKKKENKKTPVYLRIVQRRRRRRRRQRNVPSIRERVPFDSARGEIAARYHIVTVASRHPPSAVLVDINRRGVDLLIAADGC